MRNKSIEVNVAGDGTESFSGSVEYRRTGKDVVILKDLEDVKYIVISNNSGNGDSIAHPGVTVDLIPNSIRSETPEYLRDECVGKAVSRFGNRRRPTYLDYKSVIIVVLALIYLISMIYAVCTA